MYRKPRRIPTLLGLFLILAGVVSVRYLDSYTQNIVTSAKPQIAARDIQIANITDTSFVVSWFTDAPMISVLSIEGDDTKRVLLDDVDNDGVKRPTTTHFITVGSLKPETLYTLTIQPAGPASSCKNSYTCPKFRQKTSSQILTPNSLPPIQGVVQTQDGKAAEGAIVYVTVGKSSPLVGKVDNAGLWVIPLTILRSQDLLTQPTLADNESIYLTVKRGQAETAKAETDLRLIKNNAPLPTIILGRTYQFGDSPQQSTESSSTEDKVLGADVKSVDVFFPKKDGETTIDSRPRFRGVGPIGKSLLITLNSTPQTARVTVSSDGTWSWRPNQPLAPGVHHLTLKSYDAKGKVTTVSKRFIVLKSGEQVLGDATPSATIAVSPSPTVPVSPSPVVSVSASPSPSLSPTPSPLPTISPIPTPTVITNVTQPQTPPERAGSATIPLAVAGIGVLLLAASTLLRMAL